MAAGSLEMLDSDVPIFDRGDQQLETRREAEPLPELDLCIMNPPFVRGTRGNESFNFLPPSEQESVRARMRTLGKKFDFVCEQGQGAGFVTLACKRVKPGGRVAMILPSTFAAGMGKAWGEIAGKTGAKFQFGGADCQPRSGAPALFHEHQFSGVRLHRPQTAQ